MPLSEQPTDNNKQSFWRRINWELYYYERVGDRFYFHITPLAIILMLIAALCAITIIIIDLRKNPPREANINVTVPPTTSDSSNSTIIRPAPTRPSPAKVNKRSATDSQSSSGLNVNTSNRAAPQTTPISESPPGK